MKIIDLLNMMEKDENLPEKISFHGTFWELKNKGKYGYAPDYQGSSGRWLFEDGWALTNNLSDSIFIFEDRKNDGTLKHIPDQFVQSLNDAGMKFICHRINGIINYLQHTSKGDGNE